MDDREKLLGRVKISADHLAAQLGQRSNVPIEEYLSPEAAQALTDALSIDPEAVNREDLARIHLIRDGLHDALHKANDEQDANGHSIEQLLNALSRLYVDVERLVRQEDRGILEAKELVDRLASTSKELVATNISQEVATQANSIITNVHISQRVINLSVLNLDVGELNFVKNFKMNIKRLSASVFAIKLGFDKGVVFEGTIRFLNEGVDRILSDIVKFSEFIAEKYRTVRDFIEAIDPLVEKGTRFVKFIGGVIKDLFEDRTPNTSEIEFKTHTKMKSPIILSGSAAPNGDVLFGGRRGSIFRYVKRTGQFIKVPQSTTDDIFAVGALASGIGVLLGTADGVLWAKDVADNRSVSKARFSERISALAVTNWGGASAGIVSGSKSGHLRRWSLSGSLTARISTAEGKATTQKVGRSVRAITPWNDQIVVAADDQVVILDSELAIQSEVPVGLPISGMCLLGDESAAIVGNGLLGEINLKRGAYSRLLTVTPSTEYIAVAPLKDRTVIAATRSGKIRALDMNNGAEIGELDLDMTVEGITVVDNSLFVFGGSWRSETTSIVKVLWEELEATGPQEISRAIS
ncbi:hypothetical protein [Rhizobium ruizarguesonis]|uniref:hypothetical protein n=1 Tax=Rhizobium ruizarguesonis TaxID=2081791 RepID=UPI0013C06DC9|nr:hypothetical protein [Rhizobium ruizarguesonis]NEI98557.1 hypothetical protein [Rhizobium ruizarguesonis]NEJ36108.1 hypothetical protein [Rhizobium ruizarguesonis]